MKELPRITVVTPSFNQAQFLEATLRSVLGQRYPQLEYFVFDGGSTDGSAEIVARHEKELAYWISARDGGQAEAINRGFARATGDILCWLNSDDVYLPDTLWRVAAALGPRIAEPVVLTGSCFTFWEKEARGTFEPAPVIDAERLRCVDYLTQPATFWTAAAWRATGPLNESLHYAFDWEWFLRAQAAGCEFVSVPDLLAGYRMHHAHKSGSGGEPRRAEIYQVLESHGSPEARALAAWLRTHSQLWPTLSRWSGWRWHGVPDFLSALLLPRLWQLPAGCNRSRLLELFHFLQLSHPTPDA